MPPLVQLVISKPATSRGFAQWIVRGVDPPSFRSS